MKVLIETYPYPKGALPAAVEDIGRERRGHVYFDEVGYYLNAKIGDCVFILPKVLLWQEDRVFGKYRPEDFVDPAVCKPSLTSDERRFIYGFSTWIYRALAVYRKSNPDNGIIWERHVNHIGRGGTFRESETLLDVLLSLQDFARENRDFFIFTVKNARAGLNRINWSRTISRTPAFLDKDGSPVYLKPINRRREINFDEELFVIFYSILNHMRETYGFPVQIDVGYELVTGERFRAYMEEGIGQRRLLQIKYKYYSDKALKLWDLCYAFFDSDHQVRVHADYEEYLQAKDFERVFEAMVDELVGDDKGALPTPLTKQDDGKIVDHMYLERDLTSTDGMRKLFYIGDSKYYKRGTDIGKEAYSKQFTYAKNVIQWHLNILLGDESAAGYGGSHNLRDPVTEGYDVIPNFFISAAMNENLDFESDDLKPTLKEKKDYVSRHFENRLFDRDTLLIAHYDVNFLFVIALYAQDNDIRKNAWKKSVRKKFREEIQGLLKNNFDFYVMTPRRVGEERAFLKSDFQKVLGKVYKPFKDVNGRPYYSLAVDKSDPEKDNEAVRTWLAKGFLLTKKGEYKLGDDPAAALAEQVAVLEKAPQEVGYSESVVQETVLFGPCHGEKQYTDFIKKENCYHMSVEDARRFGILRREDAAAKKLLYVMVQGRGGNGGVHRFRIDGFNGEVPAAQIHELGWADTHAERYWLWHVIELPDAFNERTA